MNLGYRLVKKDSLSSFLRDNREHNHFILDKYTTFKMAGFSSDFDKWARKPETKAKLAAVKKSAWAQFTKQFPRQNSIECTNKR